MWLIIKLVAIFVITNYFRSDDVMNKLNKIAESGQEIDAKYKLVKFINEGTYGVVFKGIKLKGHVPVAIKFIKEKDIQQIEREYEILSYLDAIGKQTVENYGIPTAYEYNNNWEDCGYIVLSLLEFGLIDAVKEGHFNYTLQDSRNALNSLIMFKDFVRQSKYMHSHGVRHNDINPHNIMFRGSRSFLIDYNLSSKFDEEYKGATIVLYTSRRSMKKQVRNALDDWESFLYTMCALNDVQLKWFEEDAFLGRRKATIKQVEDMKDATHLTISKINDTIEYEPLRKVFMAFALQTFKTDSSFPDYNSLDKLISAEINGVTKSSQPALYTWIKPEHRDEARKELANVPDTVTGIKEPSKVKKFVYENPWK